MWLFTKGGETNDRHILSARYDRLAGLNWSLGHTLPTIGYRIPLQTRQDMFHLLRRVWALGYPDIAIQQIQWLRELGIEDPTHG
jgi:hypothetical protein